MGNTRSTLSFVLFLVASGIVGLYLLAYGARCMLVVIEGTAAGMDRVQWPDEPMVDWVLKSLALVGMALLLLTPAGFLTAALGNAWLPEQPVWRTILVIGPALWLFFPIGAMSTLSAGSIVVLFRPVIVTRMLRALPFTLVFYATSAVVLALAVVPWYLTVRDQMVPLLLVTAPLSAAMLLIYARQVGLMGWKIVCMGPVEERRAKRRKRRKHPIADDTEPLEVAALIEEPSEELVEQTPHTPISPTGLYEAENLVAYELAAENAPREFKEEPAPPPRHRPLDAEEEDALVPFEMSETITKIPDVLSNIPEHQIARLGDLTRARPTTSSPAPSLAGVIGFPWYPTSVFAWLWLTLGCGVLGLTVGEVMRGWAGVTN